LTAFFGPGFGAVGAVGQGVEGAFEADALEGFVVADGSRLHGVADVTREQKAYINQLERERSELRGMVFRLEKLPIFPSLPILKRSLLKPLLRRLTKRTKP
jgi:hypothetical protein